MAKKYSKRKRQQLIVSAVTASAAVGVSRLASDLEVSKQTIRRDLDELSLDGVVNRTYGGAAVRPVGLEPNINERSQFAIAEREIISTLAADLFTDGEVIMLGAGVTVQYVANRIAAQFNRLHVITNNLSAGSVLARNSGIRVVFAPGDYEANESCVCGAETLEFLKKFRADVAIFGASGLYEGGACECHSGIAWTDRVMIQQAAKRVLVMDSSKLGRSNVEMVCALEDIDVLVSDKAPEGILREKLEANGVTIIAPDDPVKLAVAS